MINDYDDRDSRDGAHRRSLAVTLFGPTFTPRRRFGGFLQHTHSHTHAPISRRIQFPLIRNMITANNNKSKELDLTPVRATSHPISCKYYVATNMSCVSGVSFCILCLFWRHLKVFSPALVCGSSVRYVLL